MTATMMAARRSTAAIAVCLLAACALSGCGLGGLESTSSLVASKPKPPVNGFDVNPADGSILIATNKGLFRIAKGSDHAQRVNAEVTTKQGRSPVGKFFIIASTGPNRLFGSGHPDNATKVPGFLGLVRSEDGGRHWSPVSRLGFADLHIIRPAGGALLYAYDAVLGGMLVSDNGGRSWNERATPPELMLDFVVDPSDSKYLVATDANTVYRSTDGSASWRPLDKAKQGRLAWPATDALYRADSDGLIYNSSDRGQTWSRIGIVEGQPYKLKALSPDHLLIALSDATVLESTDGGHNWNQIFKP